MVPGIGNSVLAWEKIRSRGGKENTVFPLPDNHIKGTFTHTTERDSVVCLGKNSNLNQGGAL